MNDTETRGFSYEVRTDTDGTRWIRDTGTDAWAVDWFQAPGSPGYHQFNPPPEGKQPSWVTPKARPVLIVRPRWPLALMVGMFGFWVGWLACSYLA